MKSVAPVPDPATKRSYVLIVDDNPAICRLFAQAFREDALEVLEATDGLAALALIDARTPAVIVTDRDMPGLDGLALVRRVRAHARAAHVPIVLVSADANAYAAEASAAGCDAMLQKPCTVGELQSIVYAAAQQRAERTPIG